MVVDVNPSLSLNKVLKSSGNEVENLPGVQQGTEKNATFRGSHSSINSANQGLNTDHLNSL